MTKFLSCLILLFGVVSPFFSQTLEEFILTDVYFDSTQLVNQKIRSVHVYSDRVVSRNNREPKVYSEKIMEAELNPFGKSTYKRFTAFKPVNDALGSNKTFYKQYTFDEQQRIVKECETKGDEESCYERHYNTKGQIVLHTNTSKYYTSSYKFTWEQEKVVDVKMSETKPDGKDIERQVKFDSAGKITDYFYENSRFHREQKINGNLKTTNWLHYKNDTLISQSISSVLIDKNVLIYDCKLNLDGDTTELLIAQYDEHGNLSFLEHKGWETPHDEDYNYLNEHHTENTFIRVTRYEVKNYYTNALLSKREILYSKSNTNRIKIERRDQITKTQRFIYETDTLPNKYWPQKKEIEEDKEYRELMDVEVVDDGPSPPAPELLPKKEEPEEIED